MRWLVTFVLFLFLTGCTKTVYKPVYKTKTVYYKPPQELIDYKIKTPKPPNKEKFIQSGPIERQKQLTFYVIDLLKTIEKYKTKNKALKDWYKQLDKAVK